MGQDVLMMRRIEIKRLQIIDKVIKRELKQVEAAKALNLSDRQLRRLTKRVKHEGESGIIHKLRGRTSHRRIPDKVHQRALGLYRRCYHGFGPTLAAEKLIERDGLVVSKETLRNWLIAEGLWHTKSNNHRRHLQWRERKDYCGQMVQMDGSHHDWLEGRGPVLVLMGFIDDATSRVYGRFYAYEGTIPAMDGLRRYINQYGIPVSIYLDRHSTYKITASETIEEQINAQRPKSHFERSCAQLGIDVIHANSPQAKGRIERLFKTLQDRLVKELRLADAKGLEQANQVLERFLIKFNRQFNIPAKEAGDMHRLMPVGTDLREVFSIRTVRCLRNDNTFAHEKKWYQVLSPTRAHQVVVQEMIDGQMNILNRDQRLKFKEISKPVNKQYKPRVRLTTRRPMPALKHPWRRYKQTLTVKP